MKSVKIIFGVAATALLLALGCFLAFLFVPDKGNVAGSDSKVEEPPVEELSFEEQAELEIERFHKEYGLDISMEEMVKELEIRREYESTYLRSYALEEVFLVDGETDLETGDQGDNSYTDMIDKIQQYVKKYHVDESRYASMTAEEELHALEVEYGPLESESMEDTGWSSKEWDLSKDMEVTNTEESGQKVPEEMDDRSMTEE